jgi:hypothetical protein
MSTNKNIHGSGTPPVKDKDKDKQVKYGPDPVIAIAEFFERRERRRKPRVLSNISKRYKK